MKYLVVGSGGTGGSIGGFMSKAGMDVTLIARGAHLAAMKENGLSFKTPDGSFSTSAKASTMEDYNESPDVIFVCVKGYSIDDCIPFIDRVANEDTVVIPILNIYGTGRNLQEKLPSIPVTDGCIYIAAQIDEPGAILMLGKVFRVVYGFRKDDDKAKVEKYMPKLQAVAADLEKCGIAPVLSDNIEKDALQKFSFVSPFAASGAYFDESAKYFKVPSEEQTMFIDCVKEVESLAKAMDINLPENIVDINLKILLDLEDASSASMHRDYNAGKSCEIDGLIYEVIRLGKKYNVPTPTYEKSAAELKRRRPDV